MGTTFRTLLTGSSKVVIIGSDCISHCTQSISAALHALDSVEIVLQPARDGGYVLVGQSSDCPGMFENIDWGTSSVLAQTFEQLKRHKYSYSLLPETFDVDVEADLLRVEEFVKTNARPHTEEWLKSHARFRC